MSKDAFLANLSKVNEVCVFFLDLTYLLRNEKIKAGEDVLKKARALRLKVPSQLASSSIVFSKNSKATPRAASKSKRALLETATAPSRIMFYYPRVPHPDSGPHTTNYTATECYEKCERGKCIKYCCSVSIDPFGYEGSCKLTID